jgi:hypothetical protein
MDTKPIPPLMAALTSNQDLQKEITDLETQMKGLDPDSPEYTYDELNLELEKEKQKIREEHPELNPLNPADAKKLDELLAQDPVAQNLRQQLKEITNEYSSEVGTWGIPWYFTSTVPAS